jgi:hypothetical protein
VFSSDSGNEARPSDATTAHRKLARQRLVIGSYVRLIVDKAAEAGVNFIDTGREAAGVSLTALRH